MLLLRITCRNVLSSPRVTRLVVPHLCPLLHLVMCVRRTCLTCFSVAKDGLASISCHHDVSSPSRMCVSDSFRVPSTLHSMSIIVIMGSIGSSPAISSPTSSQTPKFQVRYQFPFHPCPGVHASFDPLVPPSPYHCRLPLSQIVTDS